MKLFIKIFSGLIILVIAAAIGFSMIFDPNDYKDDIIKLVKEETGRDLAIPGNISLSLFPWIGVELGEISLSNAKGFGNKPFAAIKHLEVRAKLLPLLKQKLEADTLVIEGLTLDLQKNQAGQTNWDDLTKPSTKKIDDAGSEKDIKDDAPATTSMPVFAINGIEIRDAQLNWLDKQANQELAIKQVNFESGKLAANTRIPMKLSFQFAQAGLSTHINFSSNVQFSEKFKQFGFYNTNLKTEVKLAAIKNLLTTIITSQQVTLDLDKQIAEVKQLRLETANLKVNTSVSVKELLTTPYLNGQLELETFNPRELAKLMTVKLPAMSDNTALTKLNANISFKGYINTLALPSIKLNLDDTQLNGKAKLNLDKGGVHNVDLAIDQVNIDRYLPPPSKKPATKPDTQSASPASAALIPVALLGVVNLDANLDINKIQVMKTHWKNLRLSSQAKNGKISIKPLSIQGYGTTVKSSAVIQAVKDSAQLSANVDVKNLKSGALLRDFMDFDKLTGAASFNGNISSHGVTIPALKQNLNGNLKLSFLNGTIHGFSLQHLEKSLDAIANKRPAPPAPDPAKTEFANITATAKIINGVVNNNDLRAATPFTRVAGKGTVDLPEEKLNYVASIKFISETDAKTSISYDKVNAIPLDVLVRGTFSKPKVKVDFEKAIKAVIAKEIKAQERKLKEKAKTQIKAEEQKLKEKAKKEIEKKLGNELKKLFNF